MADPTGYVVDYDFSNETIPLETEFANIATSIDSLVAGVKDVRRADGKLRNGVVTLESLSGAVLSTIATGEIPADLGEADALLIAFTPTGDISASNVQAALAEVDAEKAPLVHVHNAVDIPISAISGLVAATVQAALAEMRPMMPVTGDVALTILSTAPAGWLMMDDGTIGDGSSGADHAGAAYWPLYSALWTEISDTWAPVSTGRGSTALADFNAHKRMSLLKVLGRALGVAGSGATLTARALGSVVGTETHTLVKSQVPALSFSGTTGNDSPDHAHAAVGTVGGAQASNGGGAGYLGNNTNSGGATVRHQHPFSGTTDGDGGAHPNMQPTSFLHARIKL